MTPGQLSFTSVNTFLFHPGFRGTQGGGWRQQVGGRAGGRQHWRQAPQDHRWSSVAPSWTARLTHSGPGASGMKS